MATPPSAGPDSSAAAPGAATNKAGEAADDNGSEDMSGNGEATHSEDFDGDFDSEEASMPEVPTDTPGFRIEDLDSDDWDDSMVYDWTDFKRTLYTMKRPFNKLGDFGGFIPSKLYASGKEDMDSESDLDFSDGDEDEPIKRKYRKWAWMSQIYDNWERTDFKKRVLLSRQLVRHVYGVNRHYKLKHYYNRAYNQSGSKIDFFVSLLERRLVVVLERMRLAPNLKIARRMIRFKLVLVNEDICMFADRELNPGDRVSIDAARMWIVPDLAPYLLTVSGRAWVPQSTGLDTHVHQRIEYARHVEVDHNILAGVYLNHVGLDDVRLPQPATWGEKHEGARRVFKMVFSRFKF